MAAARCPSCDAPLQGGTSCTACAVAATLVASSAPATVVATKPRKTGDPLIGAEVIGQYVIRSQLGKGGMGTVYLADQQSVGRRAVIKVLHPSHSRDPEIQTRFATEARAASQLNHPNIVTIYNYGAMADGTLFIAMEYLDGPTLDQVTAKRRLPLARVVDIVAQIADALGEAHRNGVVHRDVKPSNVMLVSRGESEDVVKVLDFGIAHIEGKRITETGAICGTPTYMSPEQIRGQTIDGRSDLYSLGCMLYELVTGEVPFEGGNTVGLAYKHVHEEPRRASEVAPKAQVPPALDEFLARALAKKPTDRPRDAATFRDELRAAIRVEPKPEKPKPEKPKPEKAKPEKPKPEKPSHAVTKPTVKVGPGLFARMLRRTPRKKSFGERLMTSVRVLGVKPRKQRRRWPWLVALAAVAMLVGGGVWLYLARSAPKHTIAQPAPTSTAQPPSKPTRTKRQSTERSKDRRIR